MAKDTINWQGILVRFCVAFILVFATYNPEGYSYYHWTIDHLPDISPLKIFSGVVLVIGWTIFLRATLRSLGPFGLILVFAFFGTFLWMLIDLGWVPADSVRAITYIVLTILCGILATGLSWSHIRRRISGQVDVDEIESE